MKKLRVTSYETNTHRHAELDSASPAYKAFNKGIAGQARNDGKKSIKIKLICFALSVIILGCYSQEKLENLNPTSYVFNASVEQVKNAMNIAGETYEFNGSLYFSDKVDYSYSYIFIDSNNINDAILYPLASFDSKIYFRSGKPLPYTSMAFHIHLDSISENKTNVEIFTLESKLYTFGIGAGHLCHIWEKEVPPSTIEEYEILLIIGEQLGEQEMPACNYPEKWLKYYTKEQEQMKR